MRGPYIRETESRVPVLVGHGIEYRYRGLNRRSPVAKAKRVYMFGA